MTVTGQCKTVSLSSQGETPLIASLIDGAWAQSRDATPLLPVLNPATEQVVAQLAPADDAIVDRALAVAAFHSWSQASPETRSAVLSETAGRLRDNLEAIAASLTREQGKTGGEARAEVNASAEVFDYYAELARRAREQIYPDAQGESRWQVVQQPFGPVAIVTPWNFPLLLAARKLAPALAAGCTVVLKPDERVPTAPLELARILIAAGLPSGALSILYGDPAAISRRLLSSPVIRKFSFTGSVAVGRQLAELAAKHLLPSTLELGGHAPVIVWDDIDIELAARQAVAAKFRNAGQVCTSPTRFYVHRRIASAFSEAFVRHTNALIVGDGDDPQVQVGPLTHAGRLAALQALVENAVAQGARLLTGGERRDRVGYFFAPTVLADVPSTARIMQEEPFGPVALINSVDSLDDAVQQANRLPLGLAAYVLAGDETVRSRLSRQLEAGIVGVNGFTASSPFTPFGGVKQSGWGYEGGEAGLNGWLQYKSIRVES
ncbi:NAD-dependent succinate-semialdehyde dehydrogenase [Brenneria sp. g21c3]|uniref:NAD-dependent succinate-semialdehyde dehydrogenase n=1 Tax=Brenneria sp. g21c3 TaxID=3093893 RepID=UPI002ECCCDBD|nr:NAD-dependent succinate-semialdehyde dehydrogenase [Brenneria sp. g21c3]